MLKRHFLYILLILGAVAGMTSCSDDRLGYDPKQDGEIREFSGEITFDLTTPNFTTSTRSLNTSAGANVVVNNLWLGVFDVNTGECFGAKRFDTFNQSMRSGTLVKNMLKVNFVAFGAQVPLAYVVAVANYDGVKTPDNRSISEMLPDFDQRGSISWSDIINLGIDTSSAYAGNKGENEDSNAPFLVGFYQEIAGTNQVPKINQFDAPEVPLSAIYPQAAADALDIQLGTAGSNQVFVASGAICLRRLVAHNTLNFNLTNGFEVTSLKYRRFNMPRSVYMLQRRTDTERYSDFSQWQRYSPNLADKYLAEGSYDIDDPSFPYESDADWTEVPVLATGAITATAEFEHFENKHWGAPGLNSQEAREALNPDGTFAALCSGPQDAYNNFASYFKLKMHVINRETGESANVEYTLHEGFCNNADGSRAQTNEDKCRDFSSLRNVNYTYNINIAGVSDITASVTSDDPNHPDGQNGNVWKMVFATGSGKETVPKAGGDFDFNGQGITFSNKPDLGFRIYGMDQSGKLTDICYNMPSGMYEGFAGLWPTGNPTYTSTLDNLGIPTILLDGMKIGNGNTFYSVVDFVKGVKNGSINPTGVYYTRFEDYDGKALGLKESSERGIYIFDRNDTRNGMDKDGCSSFCIAYGGLQKSFSRQTIEFDIAPLVVWDNVYYKKVTNKANLYVAAKEIFYGAYNSKIDLRWKHDERFQGYRITIYNSTFTHPTIVVDKDRINQYLQDYDGGKLFVYPFNTSTIPVASGATNYSFNVTPIVDPDSYEVVGNMDVVHNAKGDDSTCIRFCPTLWNISSTNDWKDLDLTNKAGGVEIHYRGLSVNSANNIDNYCKKGDHICFGGAGSPNHRYFSFWASVPGKIAVSCKSHSGSADASRQLIVARMDPNGKSVSAGGETYDEVYKSGAMAGSKTTYTTGALQLLNGQPTEYRIYAAGSIDYYSIQFIPN